MSLSLALFAALSLATAVAQNAPDLAWAARQGELQVSFAELDRLVLGRHALSKDGKDTLAHLLKLRVVDAVARDRGVVATPAEVDAMRDEIEQGVVQHGRARDLEEWLTREGVDRAEFEDSVRLAVLQQKLARQDLGMPAGQPITGEQQEVWLAGQIDERHLEELPPPWSGGVVLRCEGVTLGRDEFVSYVRRHLPPEQVREALVDLLRTRRMRLRMPDLTDAALQRAVQEEIQGRKNEVMADPQYKGIGYEQLLAAQGILWDLWPEDPAIVQAALARLWVERKYDAEGLRRVYEDERALFDERHGEAVEAWVIFLRATDDDHANELLRSYGEAERMLGEVREAVRSKADFQQRVTFLSEDKTSREQGGLLGWITRPNRPSPTREAIFDALDSGAYKPGAPENDLSRLLGPVRTQPGVLLLWLGNRRPAPAWPSMMVYVARELRARFADESLDPHTVETYLDVE